MDRSIIKIALLKKAKRGLKSLKRQKIAHKDKHKELTEMN